MELEESPRSGIGLSAVQIGSPIRACTIRTEKLKLNMINPVITDVYDKFCHQGEGCLSLPGVSIDTERYQGCTVEWLDYDEKMPKKATFYGIEAVVVQHECQHMDGILITDVQHKEEAKVGRNDPCPICSKNGIQIKYKKCKEHYD